MKFGVCTLIKNENLYVREWVEHYLKLGFDKIIIYDNNDTDGEIPNVIVQDYIDSGVVELLDKYRDKVKGEYEFQQVAAYNDCLENNKDILDWVLCCDADEFLCIEDNRNIHEVFDYMGYNKYDEVLVSWYTLGGNDLYYTNKPLSERFTKHVTYHLDYTEYEIDSEKFVKPFIKVSSGIRFNDKNMHSAVSNSVCNPMCVQLCIAKNTMALDWCCHHVMYLKHYAFKSLSEFLYRKNKRLNTFLINRYKEANGWDNKREKLLQEFIKKYNIELV